MMKYRKQLILGVVIFTVFMGPLATAQEPKIMGVKSLVVVDDNGKKVGSVLDTTVQPGINGLHFFVIGFKVKGFAFAVLLGSTRFVATASLLFESDDCTGPPLIRKDAFTDDKFFPSVALAGLDTSQPGQVVYAQDPDEVPLLTSIQSLVPNNGDPCRPLNIAVTTVNVRQIVDLGVFTRPFHVKAR